MKRTKGFTLVELLVVVAIIALLVSILLPTLGKAKEMAKQAICAANLKGVGSGILLYQSDNDDVSPWIDSTSWATTTGSHAAETSQPGTVSVTALMFLVVRSGQPVDIFRCPSDSNATKMSTTRFTSGSDSYYYWDFYDKDTDTATAHCKKVSYSYQAPLNDGSGNYSSGVSGGGALAIMADKTPVFDGNSLSSWDGISEENRKKSMSQNHSAGDFINVLFADFHVKGGKRADVGIGSDNIYSESGTSAGSQTSTTVSVSNHQHEDDSFLIGPIK